MFYRDHAPPHFHAYYGDYEITMQIATGAVEGDFPRRALAHLQEWRQLHLTELLEDWELAVLRKPLRKIDPLE